MLAVVGLAAPILWLWAAPDQTPIRNAPAESGTTIRKVFSVRFAALLLAVFGYTVMWQFFSTWYPTYLVERRGFDLATAAKCASMPFIIGIASNWAGGRVSDAITRRAGLALGRGLLGCIALACSAALFYGGIADSDRAAPWLFAAAAGVGDLFLPLAWSAATELGGSAAGTFAGLMNSASNLGAFVAPMLLGLMIQRWRNWDAALMISVSAAIAAALAWVPVYWPRPHDPATNAFSAL